MPKNTPKKDKQQSRKKSGGFVHFLFFTPMRWVLIAAVIVAVVVLFRYYLNNAANNALALFGWGSVFIFAAIVTLIALGWRRRLGVLFFNWNRWLGIIAYIFASWAIISAIKFSNDVFINGYGGSFGQDIIFHSQHAYIYVPWIIVLIAVGTFLIAPRLTLRVIKECYIWLIDNFKRPAHVEKHEPKPSQRQIFPRYSEEKPPLPKEMEEEPLAPEVSGARKKLEDLASKAAALRPGAKKIQLEQPGI